MKKISIIFMILLSVFLFFNCNNDSRQEESENQDKATADAISNYAWALPICACPVEEFGSENDEESEDCVCYTVGDLSYIYPFRALEISSEISEIIDQFRIDNIDIHGEDVLDKLAERGQIFSCFSGNNKKNYTVSLGNLQPPQNFDQSSWTKQNCKDNPRAPTLTSAIGGLTVGGGFGGFSPQGSDFKRYYDECVEQKNSEDVDIGPMTGGKKKLTAAEKKKLAEAAKKKKQAEAAKKSKEDEKKEKEEQIKELEREKLRIQQDRQTASNNNQNTRDFDDALMAIDNDIGDLKDDIKQINKDIKAAADLVNILTVGTGGIVASAIGGPWGVAAGTATIIAIKLMDNEESAQWEAMMFDEGRWDTFDCFDLECEDVDCNTQALIAVFRDMILGYKNNCDESGPDDGPCPGNNRLGINQIDDETKARLIRAGCEERRKYQGSEAECPDYNQLRNYTDQFASDICNDPRAMCGPDVVIVQPTDSEPPKGNLPLPVNREGYRQWISPEMKSRFDNLLAPFQENI